MGVHQNNSIRPACSLFFLSLAECILKAYALNAMVFLLFRASLPNSDIAARHNRSSTVASEFLLPTLSIKICCIKICTLHSHDCATKHETNNICLRRLFLFLKCTWIPTGGYSYSTWLCELVLQSCHTATLRIDINTARLSLQVLYFTHSTFPSKLSQKRYLRV